MPRASDAGAGTDRALYPDGGSSGRKRYGDNGLTVCAGRGMGSGRGRGRVSGLSGGGA